MVDVQLEPSIVLISTTKFYYVINLDNFVPIKIGTTEKKNVFGCTIAGGSLYCGRVNGVIWKVDPLTGKVESSL
jgi:hypothetical protein